MSQHVQVVSAPWCGVCGPYKEALKTAGIEFTEINADDPDNIAFISAMGIRSLPTTLVGKDDHPLTIIVGNKVKDVVEALEAL